jgi:hypothetical protein
MVVVVLLHVVRCVLAVGVRLAGLLLLSCVVGSRTLRRSGALGQGGSYLS